MNTWSDYEVDGLILSPTLFKPSPTEWQHLPINIIYNQPSEQDILQFMPDSDLHSVWIHLDGGLGTQRTISFHVFYTMQGNSTANTWAQWHLGIGWWGMAFALKLWPVPHCLWLHRCRQTPRRTRTFCGYRYVSQIIVIGGLIVWR